MKKNWRYNRPLFSSQPATARKAKKRRWVVLPFLWKAAKRTCMGLGVMVLVFTLYAVIIASQFGPIKAEPLPDEMVLFMEFKGGFAETPAPPSFTDPFAEAQPTLRELVAVIDEAAADERVKGIYGRLKPGAYPIAQVQELRDALKRFQDQEKFTYIYAESYGDVNGGFSGYYLASVFDEIWMQPMGVVSITGLNFKAPYMRTVLDKIGIEPEFFQRKDYKTAYESLTNTEMSAENQEMMESLLDDIKAELVRDIPLERGFSSAEFVKYVDQGLFTAKGAEQAKLVTKADYADILVRNIKELVKGDREAESDFFVTTAGYLQDIQQATAQNPLQKKMAPQKPKVALVYAVGAIMPSETNASVSSGVFLNNGVAAADEIAPAILDAAEDDDIKAIVLRVDSPGGSPTASESILRAVELAKGKGKVIIVSMGSTAASGGYWISAYADHIFVQPTTITGSIGVLGGKFSAEKLFENFGVNWDGVTWGQNADMWSVLGPYSDSEAVRVNAMLDQVYDGFIARVAKGRNMSPEAVDAIAGGRVWSGARAVDIGLADQIGGLTEALNYTAQKFEKANKNELNVVVFPKPSTPFEQFIDLLGGSGVIYSGLKTQAQVMQMVRPALQDISVMQHPEFFGVYQPARFR